MATVTSRQETLVVCLVESSVTLLHEWGEVLVGYLSPLLQRIAAGVIAKGVRNEFRIGFVSYSDPHVHPNPILAKRFFSPPSQLTKELKDDPASLGLGRIASGGRRGMAILEGYVSVLEMFDAAANARQPLRPHPQNEAQPEPVVLEPVCYLIHIASSRPNKATKPTWNMDPALDNVTWESLPSHLLKRKIRTSLVLIRPIIELQELYSKLSHTPESFWLPINRPSHKLLLSGLPPAPKDKIVPQKRPATDNPEPPPPQPPRPQPQEHPTPPAVAATPPTTSTFSTLPNPPNPPRPATVAPVPPSADPQPQPVPQPPQAAQPAQARSLGMPDPIKLLGFIRGIEIECRQKLILFQQARESGTTPKSELDAMEKELHQKAESRHKLLNVYSQLMRQQQLHGPPGTSSGQNPQQMNVAQTSAQVYPRPEQDQSATHVPQQIAAASGSGQGTHNSPPRTVAPTPFTGLGGPSMGQNPFQTQSRMDVQMQKMLAERTRPPVLAAAPQTQLQPPPPLNQAQPTPVNPTANIAGPGLNMTELMTPRMNVGAHVRRWQGVLAWPSTNSGARKENKIAIALFSQDTTLRCEFWPQKLILQPSRAPMNMTLIQAWNKEFSPSMGLISHTPMGDIEPTVLNIRMFRQLRDMIQSKNLLAYLKLEFPGGPPGTGILAFPTNSQGQQDILVAMIFKNAPLPAVVTAQVAQAPAQGVGGPSDPAATQHAMGAGGVPLALQNMSAETKAFLQNRRDTAVAAYNQQQVAQQQQQAQRNGLVANPQNTNLNPGSTFNVAQFMQNMQTGGDNQGGLGGLTQPPGMQPVQHGQTSTFPTNLQLLQYMNRRPDEGQGQQ